MDDKTKALLVLTQTSHIRQYLLERDPMALKQAEEALALEYSLIEVRDAAEKFAQDASASSPLDRQRLERAVAKSRELLPPIM